MARHGVREAIKRLIGFNLAQPDAILPNPVSMRRAAIPRFS
jgi:hypothetical protein